MCDIVLTGVIGKFGFGVCACHVSAFLDTDLGGINRNVCLSLKFMAVVEEASPTAIHPVKQSPAWALPPPMVWT